MHEFLTFHAVAFSKQRVLRLGPTATPSLPPFPFLLSHSPSLASQNFMEPEFIWL